MKPWEQYQSTTPAPKPWEQYAAPIEQPIAPAETGFIAGQRQRGAELANIVQNVDNVDLGSRVLQAAGGVGNTVGDVFGKAISTVQAVNPMMNLAKAIIPEQVQQDVAGAIAKPVQAFERNDAAYAAANPLAAKNFQAVRGLGNLLPMGSGQVRAGVKGAAEASGSALKNVAKAPVNAATALNTKSIYPTAAGIADRSTELYKKGQDLGADFSPQVMQDLYNAGAKELPRGKISSAIIKPDTADDFTVSLQKMLGSKSTLDDFTELDTHLGNEAAMAYKTNPDLSRKYGSMQRALRESVESNGNVTGSAEGIKAHREATRLWGIKRKADDIERAIRVGMDYDVPATGIRKQFQRIKNDDKQFNSYSKAEQKAIAKAAESGEVEGIVRTLGSRLNIVAGLSTGGVPGMLGMAALSTAGRKGSELYRVSKGQDVLKSLGERSGMVKQESRVSFDRMKEIFQLPPKEAAAILEQMKRESK